MPDAKDDITCLRHVRPYHAPEFIAERQPCRDFKDDSGRRIAVRQDDGALFCDSAEDKDVASGTIYVLCSLSGDPYIAQNRELIHKIGVTGGDVKRVLPMPDTMPHFYWQMWKLLRNINWPISIRCVWKAIASGIRGGTTGYYDCRPLWQSGAAQRMVSCAVAND